MPPDPSTLGVLVSGGLDSGILLAWLLDQGNTVQPFYIQCGQYWQLAERHALDDFLACLARPTLRPVVELQQPLADLYAGHWSVTGRGIPGYDTPDEAVFLPGRNALLVLKAALWCQMHGIGKLALATLASNPFSDAGDEFFTYLQRCLNLSNAAPLELLRPFGQLKKKQVMELGTPYPLERTFSCIDPRGLRQCGRCNKCAERRVAFDLVARPDLTEYADG